VASSGQEAKFSLTLEDNVSSAADSAADSLDHLRQRIAGGEDAIKNMRSAFNRLRGSTDEIKAAKAQLTAKLNAERDAVSAASLALLKSGTTYDAVAAKAKKMAASQDQMKKGTTSALNAAGGPLASLSSKFESLKELAGGAGGKMNLMTFAAAGLIGAAVALAAALVATLYSLGKWIIMTADAERSANLLREAWSGSARNAGNLGTQVDALADKVGTSKAVLNELAITLMKTKLGGQATVDAFNAIGQASAALGDEAGGKIKDFIERGRLMGRMRIDPREMLEGFGNLNFDDVAKALAKNTGKTVQAARLELMQGRTKLGDGAKAMRDAVEKRFGDINLRKMMSVSGLAETLQKKFAGLTKDVNIEPLLQGLGKIVNLFDTGTVTGAALKGAIDAFGKIMVSTIAKSMPFVEVFMKGLIIGALDVGIAVLKLRNYLLKTFGGSDLLKGIDGMTVALEAGKLIVYGLATAFALMAVGVALAAAPFVLIKMAVDQTVDGFKDAWARISALDWASVGKAIPQGLVDGLKMGAKFLYDGVSNLAEETKKKFKTALGIASPSKVFKGYGVNTTEGYVEGVEQGTPAAARSLDSMTAGASGGGGGAKATATAGGITVNFHYHSGGGAGGDVAAQVQEPAVRAALMRLLQEALLGAGVPVAA
jgi:hypothetical protein